MGVRDFKAYEPDRAAHERYTTLYAMYRDLHRHFGEGDTVLMQRLKELRI